MALSTLAVHHGLNWLVNELDSLGTVVDEPTARRLLTEADLGPAEVAPYVEENAASYARRCVARRENYELLVLTWRPGQCSVAHDHSGSLCGLKVAQGRLAEHLFEPGPDGAVRRTGSAHLTAGQIAVDPGVVVHALGNAADSGDLLVTVHIYSPPLPEVRRYAVADDPPAAVFLRVPPPHARVIAVIGGGFTGAMTLANLLRFGNESGFPLHVVLIDQQAAVGEGVAYRTNDRRHLLNVPANRMSAWPDRPDDFLDFARSKDPGVKPGDFLPRKIYGEYVRQTLRTLAEGAGHRLSVEVVRDEATRLMPGVSSDWAVETAGGRTFRADVAVLALGHRPPDDAFCRRWAGPRHRLIANPWAALVLSQIGPNEPVLVLGSGLTAIDAILTLDRPGRTAPLIVTSRRGLLPMPHLTAPKPPADLSALIARWLDPSTPLTVRRMLSTLRGEIAAARETGIDWRQVIDGLRPVIAQLWQRLSPPERSRFLTHVRPFWEIHRHRMSPEVADTIDRLREKKRVEIVPGSFAGATADADGIDVTLGLRGSGKKRTVRVAWVINCTGPGVQHRHSTHPILRPLLETGILCDDELSLGLQTDAIGHALDAGGNILDSLLVAGTLRKPTLWESTAVPELRQQAQAVARAALQSLTRTAAANGPGSI